MSFSDYGSTMSSRPDRPLVVKCTFDRWNKRITFTSARNCSYELLRNKVEQCFSLSAFSYSIAYKDDDGEITDITTESDLTEAIQYFQAGVDDLPVSSAASILSGRSFGGRKITLRVHVNVDYDGPSLSDTSSLASMDEYQDRNGSEISLSFSSSTPFEQDDDSVTVSSRDTSAVHAKASRPPADAAPPWAISEDIPTAPQDMVTESELDLASYAGGAESIDSMAVNGLAQDPDDRPELRYPEDPSAVFERLKLSEASQIGSPFMQCTDIPTQWLRDQKARGMNAIIGSSGASSVSESISSGASLVSDNPPEQSALDGDLALQQDLRGKYYYAYRSSYASTASQSHDSGYDETPQRDDDLEATNGSQNGDLMQSFSWPQAQEAVQEVPKARSYPSSSRPHAHSFISDPLPSVGSIHPDIPQEVLQFLEQGPLPPDECTDCSACGIKLDSFRYVCSTCGEKKPVPRVPPPRQPSPVPGKGKAKEYLIPDSLAYPPSSHRTPTSSPSASSWTLLSDTDHPLNKPLPPKPLPQLPTQNYLSSTATTLNIPRSPHATVETGYELCTNCIESAGVFHALSGTSGPGSCSSINCTPPSPEEAQRTLSQWSRSAPKRKGHFRHAFMEKVWGPGGWKDVEQDNISKCSICSTALISQRYKCVSCQKFDLCRACYGQVHEIHPSHAFLVVPDRPRRPRSEPELSIPVTDDGLGEESMTHLGVKCTHCLLDIVGARFHCAICESVDICSNCESAGLPGNLDAPDGGHNSSHIMIKIPYPLKSTEVRTASQRALHLWTGRDAPHVQRSTGRVRAHSFTSSEARTVIGSRTSHSGHGLPRCGAVQLSQPDSHRIACKACNAVITGVRYQCATCPSSPSAYNLCAKCEPKSYLLHDPMHVFFKLPRPVDQPVQSEFPIVPILYRIPAGLQRGPVTSADPKAYLHSLYHPAAVCDRCMERICGEWFRCVYCAKDLCDDCEALDTHDSTHFFLVFKSAVDMQLLLRFADLENPRGVPPLLQYPVYFS